MQVAVFGEYGGVGFGILVVAAADIGALCEDFACDTLRVFGVDPDLCAIHGLPAGTGSVFPPAAEGEQWSGFGHAVADGVGKRHLLEGLLDLGIEGGAAHDEIADVAAECLHEGVSGFFVDDVADAGNGQQGLDLVEFGSDARLVYLLHDEGHGDDDVGLHFLHGLEQQRGAGGLAEIIDAYAAAEGIEELIGEPVDVSHGQHADYAVGVVVGEIPVTVVDGGGEAFVAEHDALGGACRAGGVVDYGKVLGIVGGIMHVFGAEFSGEF